MRRPPRVVRRLRSLLAGALLVASMGEARAAGFGVERRDDGPVVTFATPELPEIPVAPHARVVESPDGTRWFVPGRDGRGWLVADSPDGPGAQPLDVDGVVTQGAFSPSGRSLVVLVRPGGWDRDAAARQGTRRGFERMHRARLVLVTLGDGLSYVLAPRPLAASASADWNPVWLDETHVLFQSLRTGVASFFVVDLATGGVRQLTNLSAFRGGRGRRSSVPVALTDGIERAATGVALFTTSPQPGEAEVWRLALRDGGRAPEVGFVARGRLGSRGADGRFEVVLDGRVVADVRADGVVERRRR